ncbi:RcnB family protein [Phenylobacterium sp. J367]|uniref:RcnB family protein n=1 Tax=Phenylobacterium sp. J367 TaxID=2898435 RepID=UPI002150DBA0|nr:RcnB family protein [Phenylobacterium sp. J367]MCR5879359.1 RcnB family protein [Phenylobacterium sp. J367]
MKKTLLIAAAAAMTFTSVAATAQPYGHYGRGGYDARYRDSDRDGRPDHREWNRDRDRDGRPDQYDRYDNRRGDRYGYSNHRWRTGQRYPYYNNRGYYISDYRAYRLPPPRAGYRYYRTDNGDIVMAAIASGIIGLVIGSALSDNDHRDYRRDYYGRW